MPISYCLVPNLRFSDYNDSLKNICLSELLSFQNGINADSDKYGKGIKYISVGDIINNDFITYDCIKGKVDISQKELNNYLVENGDILFQRSSETFEDIGNANVYLDEQPCTFGGFVIRGKKIGEYDPKYLNYLLKSPNARKQVIRLGAGAQHYNINQESLNKIILSFPSAKEQEKISQFLTKIEEQIQLQNKIIEDYETLRNTINLQVIGKKDPNTKISECLDCFSSSKKESDILVSPEGDFPAFGANGLIRRIDKYDYQTSGISIVKDGAGVGKMYYLTGKYSIVGTQNLLQSKNGYNLVYLYYALQNFDFRKYIVGSGIPHIYFKDYKNESIYIPESKKMISTISKCLASIDTKITIEKGILNRLLKQKEYLLQNLFI